MAPVRLVVAPDLDELLHDYAELDQLLERALFACQAGDRECAILLSSAAVTTMTALDRRLRRAGLLPACTP